MHALVDFVGVTNRPPPMSCRQPQGHLAFGRRRGRLDFSRPLCHQRLDAIAQSSLGHSCRNKAGVAYSSALLSLPLTANTAPVASSWARANGNSGWM